MKKWIQFECNEHSISTRNCAILPIHNLQKDPPHLSLGRATLKAQNLMETTPTAALTRGGIYRGQSRTWFQKLRKQHLLLLLQKCCSCNWGVGWGTCGRNMMLEVVLSVGFSFACSPLAWECDTVHDAKKSAECLKLRLDCEGEPPHPECIGPPPPPCKRVPLPLVWVWEPTCLQECLLCNTTWLCYQVPFHRK